MSPELSLPCTSHCWCHYGVAGEGRSQLSMALGHQHGFTWPLVATWPTDINIDPYCGRATSLGMAPRSSTGPYITMASCARAGLSCQVVLHYHHVSSSASLYSTHTALLLFLSRLFTAYLLIILVAPVASGYLLSCAAWLQEGLVTSLRFFFFF